LGRGTSIGTFRNPASLEEMCNTAARGGQHHDKPNLMYADKIGFSENRLFSFYDSPIAFHGVEEQSSITHAGPRRMIRIHIGTVWNEEPFGEIPIEDFVRLSNEPDSPEYLSFVKMRVEEALAANEDYRNDVPGKVDEVKISMHAALSEGFDPIIFRPMEDI